MICKDYPEELNHSYDKIISLKKIA